MTFQRPPSEAPLAAASAASPRRTLRRVLPMVAVLGVASAATWTVMHDDPKPKRTDARVRVSATTDDGRPLARTIVVAAGQSLVTDATGTAEVTVQGAVGATIPIKTTCPEGHREGRPPPSHMFTARAAAPRLVQVEIVCERETRVAAVLVHALARERTTRVSGSYRAVSEGTPFPVAGALVILDGQVAGRTDGEGFAHVALQRTPGTKIDLVIRPPDQVGTAPALVQLAVGGEDDVHAFERTFTLEREIVERVRRKRRVEDPKPKNIRVLDTRGAPFQEL